MKILVLGMGTPSVPGRPVFALGRVPSVPGVWEIFVLDKAPSVAGVILSLDKVPSAPGVIFALDEVHSVAGVILAPDKASSVPDGVTAPVYMAPTEPHHVQAAHRVAILAVAFVVAFALEVEPSSAPVSDPAPAFFEHLPPPLPHAVACFWLVLPLPEASCKLLIGWGRSLSSSADLSVLASRQDSSSGAKMAGCNRTKFSEWRSVRLSDLVNK